MIAAHRAQRGSVEVCFDCRAASCAVWLSHWLVWWGPCVVPYHPARGHAMAELGLLVVCHGAAPYRSGVEEGDRTHNLLRITEMEIPQQAMDGR